MKEKTDTREAQTVKQPGKVIRQDTFIKEAYKRIKQMIFEQKFAPGQRLVYEDLARLFSMSRTPIINALNRLEQEGFVASEDFRGFYVRPIDPQEVWEAFGVREALEVYAVEQAITIGDAEGLSALEERLQEHEDYRPHYYTRKKFLLDSEFHLQIARMAKNRVLRYLLKRNFEHIFLRARLENYNQGRVPLSAEEHHKLVDSIKRKDILGSIEILRNHIHRARDEVLRCLNQEESGEN